MRCRPRFCSHEARGVSPTSSGEAATSARCGAVSGAGVTAPYPLRPHATSQKSHPRQGRGWWLRLQACNARHWCFAAQATRTSTNATAATPRPTSQRRDTSRSRRAARQRTKSEHFLTGIRRPLLRDRVLATVLFTDIVGSTDHAAELGDSAWRALLERHDALVREQIARHRGRFVKSLGDGMLATFDGPSRAINSAMAIVTACVSLAWRFAPGCTLANVSYSPIATSAVSPSMWPRASAASPARARP